MASSGDFYLEEYKALRAEILAKLEAISRTEVLVATAIAALYAWLATHHVSERTVWAAPSILVFLGGARAYFLGRQIGILGEYVLKLEDDLISQPAKGTHAEGWEHYRSRSAVKSRFFDAVARAFWIVAFIGTFALPFVLGGSVASQPSRTDTLTVNKVPP